MDLEGEWVGNSAVREGQGVRGALVLVRLIGLTKRRGDA